MGYRWFVTAHILSEMCYFNTFKFLRWIQIYFWTHVILQKKERNKEIGARNVGGSMVEHLQCEDYWAESPVPQNYKNKKESKIAKF